MAENMIDKIEHRQLICFGHKKQRWSERNLEYTPTNRRRRSRPHRSWSEGIQVAMRRRKMN